MRAAAVVGLVVALTGPQAAAQTRGRGAAQAAPVVVSAEVKCPMILGEGVQTQLTYCDVPIALDPAEGVIVTVPPHTGQATLMFDLHNRHTYSEQQVKNNRGYRRFIATVGVLTMDNFPVSKAVVMNEFRTAADLVDRIGGGSGPGGLKAVAPTGSERVIMTLPSGVEAVSIVGLELSETRFEGAAPDVFRTPGRPIAIVSNVMLEYSPAAARGGRRGASSR